MTSFKKLQERRAEIKNRLAERSNLDPNLVENVMQYAKHLLDQTSNEITDNVFMGQMMNRFQITNQIMVNQMFEVLQRNRRKNMVGKELQQGSAKSRTICLEDFCWVICVFLTNNLTTKTDWVFAVYDANDDGNLSKMELYLLLKPCILHTDEMETEEAIKDLIDIVMMVVDVNKNGQVDREEFRELVRKNVLYIDLLGQCIPNELVVKKFLHEIENKTPMEVSRMFQEEKDRGLLVPTISTEESLYPIALDLP